MFWKIKIENIQTLVGFFADIVGVAIGIIGLIWGGKKIRNKFVVNTNTALFFGKNIDFSTNKSTYNFTLNILDGKVDKNIDLDNF